MLTPIGSRTLLGPSMDPAMALQYTKHDPLYIGYIFVFYATNMGPRDSGDTLVDPIGSRTRLRLSMDPAMALQYTKHGPLYICLVYCRTMAGSIEGPRRVLDPMREDLCVPRVL